MNLRHISPHDPEGMDAKISGEGAGSAAMRWMLAAGVVAACQSGTTAAAPSSPYTRDIGKLCDSIRLADASDKHGQERQLLVAMWLGKNLETPEAHDFLVHIQPLEGSAKASALDDEAHRVGLAKCALADEWR